MDSPSWAVGLWQSGKYYEGWVGDIDELLLYLRQWYCICTVVPVTCGPRRAKNAKESLGLLKLSQSEGISASLKHALVDPRVSYGFVFARVLDASRTGISPLAGCLAPAPTVVCYSCQRTTCLLWWHTSQCQVPSQSRRSSFNVEFATSVMALPSLATRRKDMSTTYHLGQQKRQMLHILTDWLWATLHHLGKLEDGECVVTVSLLTFCLFTVIMHGFRLLSDG